MPEEAIDLIEAFCRIKIRQHTQPLTPAEHAEGQRLEGWLRSLIDGAPSPARGMSAPQAQPAPAPKDEEGPAPLPLEAAMRELTGPLDAPAEPRAPLDAAEIPASGYTPPAVQGYLSDYFSEDLQPVKVPSGAIYGVVDAQGAPVQLSEEQRALYGIGEAPADRPAPPREAPPEPVRADAPAPAVGAGGFTAARPAGSPSVLHLLDGGVVRGMVRRFDPAEGAIEVFARGRPSPQRVELSALAAVFFGPGSYEEPEAGSVVAVRLNNGRELSGLSPDFRDEAPYFTLRPSDLRGNVARIWVSREAVAELKTRPVQG